MHSLAFIPDSSLQQRNVEHREILGTDEVDTRSLLLRCRLAGNLEAPFPTVARRGCVCGKRGRTKLRRRSGLPQALIEARSPTFPDGEGRAVQRGATRHKL